MPLPAHVPEVKARLEAGTDKSPAIAAKGGRAKVVRGELNPGREANVRCSQRGRGLGAELDKVATGVGMTASRARFARAWSRQPGCLPARRAFTSLSTAR